MTRQQVTGEVEKYLGVDEIIKALNVISTYLQGHETHLHAKFSDLRKGYDKLHNKHLQDNDDVNYETGLAKIKASIRHYLQDLPELTSPEGQVAPGKKEDKKDPPGDPESLWAFIWRIITNPKILASVVILALLTYLLLRLTGRDLLCILFNDCTPESTYVISNKTWAEAQASNKSKDYAILSVIQHISFQDVVERNIRIRRAYYRNTYTIRALRDIGEKEDVFLEQYTSSNGQDIVEQWAGSEKQDVQSHVDRIYWVRFKAKKNEVKIITTGANYRYSIPLKDPNSSSSCFPTLSLARDEWMVCYPNDLDYIDKLTILVETHGINLTYISNAAYRKHADPVISDATCNLFPDTSQKCTMVATWENVAPGDCVALKMKWQLPG